MNLRLHDPTYFAEQLVDPRTRGALRVGRRLLNVLGGQSLQRSDRTVVPMVSGIPVFVGAEGSPQQEAELSFTRQYVASRRGIKGQDANTNARRLSEWAMPWIEPILATQPMARVVCIGGSYADDLPTVRALHKFNIDHLAHRYVEFAEPEMREADTTYVVASAEQLPFADESVDIVYIRNALDHFDNPWRCLREIHRILKPEGLFMFAAYYNSTFIDDHETKVIDSEFVSRFVASLFVEQHLSFAPVEQQVTVGYEPTEFIYYVGSPKGGQPVFPVSEDLLDQAADMANSFQAALQARVAGSPNAIGLFHKVVRARAIVETDAHRQLFAALQILCMTDPKALSAAASSIRNAGLSDAWRAAADLVFGHHKWTLDTCPPSSVPVRSGDLFNEQDWNRMLLASQAAVEASRTRSQTKSKEA